MIKDGSGNQGDKVMTACPNCLKEFENKPGNERVCHIMECMGE